MRQVPKEVETTIYFWLLQVFCVQGDSTSAAAADGRDEGSLPGASQPVVRGSAFCTVMSRVESSHFTVS